ncbi:cell filamentation protein Fic [bacterium]|nr:cell filamentation protein Fic [bacterium]
MVEHHRDDPNLRLAGYAELVRRYNLEVVPNRHRSWVATTGTHTIHTSGDIVEEIYPLKYRPGDEVGKHLEFALKYDGVNLGILAALFEAVEEEDILQYVASKRTGKYSRRIWYLFELMTSKKLPLDNLSQGNYVDVLDPDQYYTADPAKKIQRQRVNDNLLGNHAFCATIRKTETLKQYRQAGLPAQVQNVIAGYSTRQLKHALSYLYTKETKSSFEIEQETPGAGRTERFVALLHLAETEDFCRKERLIDLQNRIVDPRFRESDYRSRQNFIGQTVRMGLERIHFVCPKPEDIHDLMEGLLECHARLDRSDIEPVLHAAVIAYGFVFLHPFEDGNGRIHRFLIHNILARRGFIPPGIMFPVSAAMLNHMNEYDQSLEVFSRNILSLVDYNLEDDGSMSVYNETAHWYRYMDLTPQAEALFGFIEKTIETELVEELEFLAKYDDTKNAIQNIVDMPDQNIDLFIRLCIQNQGKLSGRIRERYFGYLHDDELVQMEKVVQEVFIKDADG